MLNKEKLLKIFEKYKNASTGGIYMTKWDAMVDDILSSQTIGKPNVKCWCFLCHIELVEEKDKLEMHGETVCQQCWDDNMYMALQNGGGC